MIGTMSPACEHLVELIRIRWQAMDGDAPQGSAGQGG